ncbi:cilia- and flagella-associated protein 36 [Bombina bombina]|uniref:cilia- and flagella-associated protein 36 n=1 Tax=Bombina bombina TaxID=8345 RepID=UPI00235AF43E|nr:cilia- and flagella-associated protein 36 [Bombina bombina]
MADDAEWVLESILGFMSGPIWMTPVMDFVEQKCSVFDDEDENKLSYTEVHNEYKELVEKLLQGHLNEVGINEEQFQEACTSPLAHSPSLKTMLQPVLAGDDFKIFKAMMVQRNIELQLQAIRIIQERNGILPDCLQSGTDIISDLEQQEMKLISEAIRISKEEYEKEQLRKTSVERPVTTLHDQSKKAISKGDEGKSKMSGETVKAYEDRKQPLKIKDDPCPPPSIALKSASSTEAAEAWLEQARKEAGIQGSVTGLSQTEIEQLQQRAEYLRQKREILLAKKLESKRVLQNTDENEVKASCSRQEMTEEEKKNLEKRKHLAETLKKEVIKK